MTIAEFDHLGNEEKKALLFQCCGSFSWVEKMLKMPPAEDLIDLFEDAEEKWYECTEADWKEAFTHHPKIGDMETLRKRFSSDRFAGREQAVVNEASEKILEQLAQANKVYEDKYGYIFIVSATGKSAEEMLGILTARLQNDPKEEIKIAMDEQNKIIRLRLEKLFDV